MILNQSCKEHLVPIPNGYGIVRFPQFRGHPGLLVFGVVSMFLGVIMAVGVEAIKDREIRSHGRILYVLNKNILV